MATDRARRVETCQAAQVTPQLAAECGPSNRTERPRRPVKTATYRAQPDDA
jgi:hypothetical protein